jgi:glycosyltransferase involved in cell wall biosynthesis
MQLAPPGEGKAVADKGVPVRPPRIGVFVVTFHAAATIAEVLRRIKPRTWERISEVFIFDDSSSDSTCEAALRQKLDGNLAKVRVYHNEVNLGYGGNQKRGYRYAAARDFDIVVLLHGDGQYAPEALDDLIDPIARGEADFVLGSRMLVPGGALRGGMPLYKYLGNKILTRMQNLLLGCRLSEYHSGYRAYRVEVLKKLPLLANSNDFHFDNEIVVQLVEGGYRIQEVPIPTYYGDEICRVNGLKYAWNVLLTNVRYRLHKAGLLYARQFDLRRGHKYTFKQNRFSSHQRIRRLVGEPPAGHSRKPLIVDVGCGAGFLSALLAKAGNKVIGVDMYDSPEARRNCNRFVVANVEQSLGVKAGETVDTFVFADVLEHTREPEEILLRARRHLKSGGRVIASTGNVAHLFIRLSLLLGWFTYTERGILDRTHTRLFTVATFRRLFRECGFRVERIRYCPIPFENVLRGWPRLSGALCWLNMLLAWLLPSLFAYQVVVEAKPNPAPSTFLRREEILKPDFIEWTTENQVDSRAA